MTKKYYTLVQLEAGKWSPQFGDYSKAVVTQERRDMHESFPCPKLKDLRVISSADDQTSINAAVAALNVHTLPVIGQLQAIAASEPELLVSYADDLNKHDANALALSVKGERFVWLLRDHGTELFRLNIGRDPVFVTFWIDQKRQGPSAAKHRAYLVTVTSDGGLTGTVSPITHEEATRYACEPANKAANPVTIETGSSGCMVLIEPPLRAGLTRRVFRYMPNGALEYATFEDWRANRDRARFYGFASRELPESMVSA